mmetsp:Transcript_5270/g.11563  ORF Transcript_5270/g.11563 Transcript_5270/m.11563 type:complete len:115 (+) Transcript_5270:367-711(+)
MGPHEPSIHTPLHACMHLRAKGIYYFAESRAQVCTAAAPPLPKAKAEAPGKLKCDAVFAMVQGQLMTTAGVERGACIPTSAADTNGRASRAHAPAEGDERARRCVCHAQAREAT